jgi:hypothetical protein
VPTNFREIGLGEVRRITIPRTRVNKLAIPHPHHPHGLSQRLPTLPEDHGQHSKRSQGIGPPPTEGRVEAHGGQQRDLSGLELDNRYLE